MDLCKQICQIVNFQVCDNIDNLAQFCAVNISRKSISRKQDIISMCLFIYQVKMKEKGEMRF